MKIIILTVVLVVGGAVNQETFRGRLNPGGTQAAENLMRDMIRRVNDLIKQYTRLNNMQIGPVNVEGFNVRTLDTANVNIIMNNNRLGVQLSNGNVHLTAQLAVYIPILFGQIRVAGQFDTYGNGISGHLDSSLGVSGGHFYSHGMGCSLNIGSPRVDLHLPIINHLANMILQGLMPSVTGAVCEGIKKYGNGMVNSVFQAIPTDLNVFNLFRLHFPVMNFRSWSRRMVAGVGMEVRPVSNVNVDQSAIRIVALQDAEDGHMACTTISDFVINTASRTFLPVGKSFSFDVGSVLQKFFGSIFVNKMFVEGTLTTAPMFLAEPQEMVFTAAASGRLLNARGEVVPGTETDPITVTVTAPNDEEPMFSNVKVQISGPVNIKVDVNIAAIIDMIIDFIDQGSRNAGKVEKRANNSDLTRVLNEMFFSRFFSGFSVSLSTRHGSVIACMNGTPTGTAVNTVYNALRASFG